MNILKLIISVVAVFVTFTTSVFFVSLLGHPAPQIKGHICIKISREKTVKLNDAAILLIKKSEAKRLRNNSINKLSLLKRQLDFSQPAAFSDAEGKFSLVAPSDEYAIAVLATKTINGEHSVFFWLVEVNNYQKLQIISLDNNNLTEDFVAEELY